MGHGCRELLLKQDINAVHAADIDEAHPRCECEGCSLSRLGPVQSSELLIRFVLSPMHINEKSGAIKATSISHAQTTGLSTFRDGYVSDTELVKSAEYLVDKLRARNPKHGLYGVLLFPASLPKDPRTEENGKTVYCIYDTPHLDVESHAEIFQTVNDTPNEIQELRRHWLFDRIKGTFVNVSQFRGGILSHLAPT